MPCPAPVTIATLPSRRLLISDPVDEVEALCDDRLTGVVVAPDGLHHHEGHRLALALLLVEVDDLALTREHVAHHDRLVIPELLLAVQDDPALRREAPHYRVH